MLHGYGLAGCHSSRSNDLPVHARIGSSGKIRLLWESDVDTRNGHAAIFEVKFGKRQTEQLKHRASVRLNNSSTTFESVALVVEGSDLGTSEDRFEPTASCINDTEKRPLVTRSGLSIPRCCVCHLHHKWAMTSPAAVREFFGSVLQQVCHLKFDVIAGDANAAAYKYYKKQEYPDLYDSSVAVMLRETKREVNTGHPFENRLHIDYSTNFHPTQLHAANDIDGWRRTQDHEKTLEQSYAGSGHGFT